MSPTIRQKYKRYDIYDEFVKKHDIFNNYRDMFVFCGCVGYHENKIQKKDYTGTGEGEQQGEQLWMHFTDEPAIRAAAASIAYDETNNLQALTNPETQLKILAKYAAGGARFLQSKFGGKSNPRSALLDYIRSNIDTADEESDGTDLLTRLIKEADPVTN